MIASPKHRIVADILEHNGRLFSQELGIDLAGEDPGAALRWLMASKVLTRIPLLDDWSESLGRLDVTSITSLGYRDLDELRAEAGEDPGKLRALLAGRFGLDEAAIDTFFREMQLGWDELWPFADRIALDAARRLDIGETAEELTLLVDPDDYVCLVVGLVRVSLGARRELSDMLEAA